MTWSPSGSNRVRHISFVVPHSSKTRLTAVRECPDPASAGGKIDAKAQVPLPLSEIASRWCSFRPSERTHETDGFPRLGQSEGGIDESGCNRWYGPYRIKASQQSAGA